jgi:hypothetical protein
VAGRYGGAVFLFGSGLWGRPLGWTVLEKSPWFLFVIQIDNLIEPHFSIHEYFYFFVISLLPILSIIQSRIKNEITH